MYLCIDIGGTKTLIALFSHRGRVVRRRKFATAQDFEEFTADLGKYLQEFRKYQILGIVVAIPGVVQKNYSVKFGNRDWVGVDLLTPIKNLFNCPIWFKNDANLGALYEGSLLHGRTVFLTFSTGIGGGVVEKGQILPESDELEPGHWIYNYAGETLEWEDIAAASAIEKAHKVRYATELRGREELADVAARVMLGLPEIIDRYHPQTIVLGGPLGKIFKLYTKYMPRKIQRIVRRPKRPTESVIYGGYLYSRQKTAKPRKARR